MAALGDSITRAFDSCGWFVDCPGHSWSTGADSDGVTSHFERLRALDSTMSTAYNDARTGATVDELPAQASKAAGQGAGYVTILMGANDACTDTVDAMTPVADFRSSVDAALNALDGRQVFVSSIPDVYQLWKVGHTSFSAVFVWGSADICQSLLANPTSTSTTDENRRQLVRERVIAYNAELADACSFHTGCHYDGGAVFNYPFSLSQVSTWDYFHPNETGQAVLAEQTWAHAGIDWGAASTGGGGGKGGGPKK